MKEKDRKQHGIERESVKFSVEVILRKRLQRFESLEWLVWGHGHGRVCYLSFIYRRHYQCR